MNDQPLWIPSPERVAASNMAGSSDLIEGEPPSLLARVSYSGWPLGRSRISTATSRS